MKFKKNIRHIYKIKLIKIIKLIKNKTMAYLCVNKDGQECIAHYNPTRNVCSDEWVDEENFKGDSIFEDILVDYIIELPEGTIEKLINKKITWEDDPIEIKSYG